MNELKQYLQERRPEVLKDQKTIIAEVEREGYKLAEQCKLSNEDKKDIAATFYQIGIYEAINHIY